MAVASVTTDQIVKAYQDTLGRTPGPEEINFWVNYSTTNDPTQTANAFLAGAQDEIASRQTVNVPAATSSSVVLNLPTRTTIPAPVDVNTLAAATGPVLPVAQPSVTSDQIVESYTKYLNRTPSAEEIAFWSDYSKTNNPTQTAEAFLAGAKNEIANVTKSGYESYLGRTPSQEELNFWTNYTIEQGAPQAAAAWKAGADQELAAQGKQPQTQQGLPSATSSVTEQQILDSYNKFLNRTPSAEEVAYWVDYGRTANPTQTAEAFINSARKEIGDITRSGYVSYLGREPSQEELDYWTNYTIENDATQAANAWRAGADEELARRSTVSDATTDLQKSGLQGSLVSESTAGLPYGGGIYKRTPEEEARYLSELAGIPVRTSIPLPVMPMSTGPSAALTRARQPGDIGEEAYYGAIRNVVSSGDYTPAQLRQMQQNVGTSSQDINIAMGTGMTPMNIATPTMPGATAGTTQSIDEFIRSKAPTTAAPTTPSMFSPENVSAQLELERLKAMNAPRTTDQAPVAGFAQGGMVSNDVNRLLQNQRQAMQRDSQSRQMLSTLGAPPVKKLADGGPAGSSSGVRRLEMSGYQEGGEVTPMLSPEQLEEFNRNMQRELDEENRRFEESGGPEFYSAIRPAMEDINERVKQTLDLYRMGRATEADVQKLLPSLSEYEIASQFGRTDTGGYRSKDIGAPSRDRLREFIEIQKPTIDADRPDMFPYDPRGSKAQGRVLEMSKGGDVTNDEFIQEMMTGTRPEDFPKTSPVDTAVSDFISSRSKLVTDPQEFFRVMGQNLEEYHGKPLREDPEKYLMEQLGPGQGLMGAIKPKGGIMPTTPGTPWGDYIDEVIGAAQKSYANIAPDRREGVVDFIKKKLGKYIRSDFGTEEDPLRRAIESGRLETFGKDKDTFRSYALKAAREGDPDAVYDVTKAYDIGTGIRPTVMLPTRDFGEGQLAKQKAVDDLVSKIVAEGGDEQIARSIVERQLRSLSRDETDKALQTGEEGYSKIFRTFGVDKTKPKDMAFFERALDQGDIAYGRDLLSLQFLRPQDLTEALGAIPPNKLASMDFAEAVVEGNRLIKKSRDFEEILRIAEKGKGSTLPKETLFFGTTPLRTPAKSGQWVQITDPDAARLEGALMGHSVGGYGKEGAYNLGGKQALLSGKANLFSLRDEKGLPLVTVEMENMATQRMSDREARKTPDFKIRQVQGRFNSAPEEYLDDVFNLAETVNGRWSEGLAGRQRYSKDRTGKEFDEPKVINWGELFANRKAQGKAAGGEITKFIKDNR